MPSKQVVSDEALSAALGMYAGMVGQVLNNPRRWLGVDEDPPLTAGLPARVLDAVRDRALGDVTPASPHWAAPARTFLDLQDLFDERPRGGLVARTLAKLPVVGVAGGWLDERGAIRKAAKQTQRLIA